MALTDRYESKVEVLPDGQLQVRKTRIIEEDGKIISRTHQRHVVDVGDDVTNEDQMVKDIAATIHTPARVSARAAVKAQQDEI